jgi:transposase
MVKTYKAGGITQRELSVRFRVSLFFVVKLMRLYQRGEQLQPKTQGANLKSTLTGEISQFTQSKLVEQSDLSLLEL